MTRERRNGLRSKRNKPCRRGFIRLRNKYRQLVQLHSKDRSCLNIAANDGYRVRTDADGRNYERQVVRRNRSDKVAVEEKLEKLVRGRCVHRNPNRHVVHAVIVVQSEEIAVDGRPNENLCLVPKRGSPVDSNLHFVRNAI